MSHPWPELLRITLCPDQVILQCCTRINSLNDMEPRCLEAEIIPVEPRHEPTLWTAPLAVLGIALDGLPERPHDAEVILSNHFVPYPLIHSDTAREPEYNVSVIDVGLRSSLIELLEQHNCRLTSLQPRIVAFGRDLLEEFQEEPGWVVLVEEGLASVGLVRSGEFTRFRNLYMWPASSVELLTLLDREAAMAGLKRPPRNLMLWRRDESDEVVLPLKSGWQITHLGEIPTTAMPRRTVSRRVPLSSAHA